MPKIPSTKPENSLPSPPRDVKGGKPPEKQKERPRDEWWNRPITEGPAGGWASS